MSSWIYDAILLIFAAGTFWAQFRRVKSDLNGLGRRERKHERNTLLALLTLAKTDEERRVLLDLFKE